jgi:histidyl-tRNA synthetase
VIDNLTARGLAEYVRVDYGVIRGLAYYTGIVFEAFDRQGEFRAIAGGGRYDNLVKLVSGGKVDLPALGFGMGDVVLTQLLRERGRTQPCAPRLDLYCLIEDESVRPETLRLIQQLRDAGCAVDFALTPTKPDKQFKRALELAARQTLRLERTPDGTLSVRVKTLATRAETVLRREEVLAHLRAQPATGAA